MENANGTPVLYTLGYQNGWSPEALKAVAEKLGAVVIDARFNPQSRLPQWRKGPLMRALGDLYEHHQRLGNINYKNGGPIQLQDPHGASANLQGHVKSGRSLILMCGCKDYAVCHRTHAASFLASELGLDVIHLGTSAEELA